MRRGVKIFVVAIISISGVLAGQGSAGAQFLQIFGGTRGSAHAGAFVSYEGTVQSIYWNPACVRSISRTTFSFTHGEYFAGINYENVALVTPFGYGTLGIFGIGLLSGKIEETTEIEDEGTGRFFTANDYAVGLTFSRAMTNKFDAGVSLKVINQNLAKVSAMGWAFDLGALYKTGLFGNIKIGFVVRNYGPDMQYSGEGLLGFIKKSENPAAEEDVKYELVSERYPIPISFNLGASMNFRVGGSSNILINFNALNSVDQRETITMSVEYQIPEFIYFAIGHGNMNALLNPGISDESLGGNMRGFAYGGGINFGRFTGKSLWVEYSYESHKYLNPVRRVGIEMAF